jgi:hypothetical protein
MRCKCYTVLTDQAHNVAESAESDACAGALERAASSRHGTSAWPAHGKFVVPLIVVMSMFMMQPAYQLTECYYVRTTCHTTISTVQQSTRTPLLTAIGSK